MKTDLRKNTLKPGEIIPMTFDYVFTAIFNNEDNIDIVESFLSCYFDIDIKELKGKVKLLKRELNLESKKEKNKQVDFIADINGEKINIELSNEPNKGIINRNVIYACNIHSRQLKYGINNYNKIKRTIQITLNNKHTNKELKETYYLMNKRGEILTEKFQIDNLDMEIGKKICYTEDENKLARWCMALTSKTEEEFKKSLEGGLMEKETKEKLVEEVNKYSRDEEVIALYTKHTKEEIERNTMIDDAHNEGYKNGFEQGIEKGIEKNKLEIAKNMIKENIDIDIISKITGLTKEEIEKL